MSLCPHVPVKLHASSHSPAQGSGHPKLGPQRLPLLVLVNDSLIPGVLIFKVTTSPDCRLLEGNISLPFPGYMQPGVTCSGNSVVTANVFLGQSLIL